MNNMKEIDQFMQGWWNCFITVSTNTGTSNSETLKCAGITIEEIELLLLSDIDIPIKVLKNIVEYKDSLINK